MQGKEESNVSLPYQKNYDQEEEMKDESQNTKDKIKKKLKSCAKKLIQFLECSSVFTLQKIQQIHDEELASDLQGSELSEDKHSSYTEKKSYRSSFKQENASSVTSQRPKKTMIWFKERQNFDESVQDRFQSRMSKQTKQTVNRQYRHYLQTRTRHQEFTEWFFCQPPKVYDDYWSRQACPLTDYLKAKQEKQHDFNYNYYDYDLDQSQSIEPDQSQQMKSMKSDEKASSKKDSQSMKSDGKVSDKISQYNKKQFNEMDLYLLSMSHDKNTNKKNDQQIQVKEEEDCYVDISSKKSKNNEDYANSQEHKTKTTAIPVKKEKKMRNNKIRETPATYQGQYQENISDRVEKQKQKQKEGNQLNKQPINKPEQNNRSDKPDQADQIDNIQSRNQQEKVNTDEQKAKQNKLLNESEESQNEKPNNSKINDQSQLGQSEDVERESSQKLQNLSESSKIQGPTYKKMKKQSKISKMKAITPERQQKQQQEICFDVENIGNKQQFIVDISDEENEIPIIYDHSESMEMQKKDMSDKRIKINEASFMSETVDKSQTQNLKFNKKRRRKNYQYSNQSAQSHHKSKKQQIRQEQEQIEAIFYLDEQEIQ